MSKDFTMTILSDKTPKEVFNAILDVRRWWSGFYNEEFKGESRKLNDEFTFRAGDGAHFSKQKLVEVVPDKKLVWLVTESELTFIEQKDEWKGTKIIFELFTKENKTQVRFTHQGLMPEVECYDACSSAWTQYLREKLLGMIHSTEKAQQQ